MVPGTRKGTGRARYDNNTDYRGIREITGKRRARYIIEHWPDTTPWAKCV